MNIRGQVMKQIYKTTWAILVLALFNAVSFAVASVVVSPGSVQVKPNGQVQFSATGSTNGLVVWGLSGAGCVGITCGHIDSSGLYTAPSTAPTPPNVTVTAVSLFDPSQTGAAQVTIATAAS